MGITSLNTLSAISVSSVALQVFVPIFKFMAVLLQVLQADIMVDANNTPLQQAERPLYGVDMDIYP